MPDMTTEYFWHCATAESWSTTVQGSKGAEYTVSWNKWGHKNQHNVHYDYSCDCKGYKFSKGQDCSHIKQVKASGDHCNWIQFTNGGDAVKKNGEYHCPECGSDVKSMGWGV